MKRESEIRMNVSPIAGIRSTYLQVDSHSHHRQPRRRISELLMREAVDLHPSHPEVRSVDQSSLLRLVVSLYQENLRPEPARKDSARHRSCHPALFGNQPVQHQYRQAFPEGWAVGEAWASFCALFFRGGVSSALSEDRGMDPQYQIPLLFVKVVGAWPSAYFTWHLCSTFMLRIPLNRFVWVAAYDTPQE